MSKPKVITLCGSSRFKEAHEKAQAELTLQGHIVIPMGLYGHLAGIDMDGEIKKKLDELHFRKIDISTSIFVVNHSVAICKSCHKPIDPYKELADASPCCPGRVYGNNGFT